MTTGVELFLKIDGIVGESTDAKHKDWIDVRSYAWGEASPVANVSGGGGVGAGKVDMHDFHFAMPVSRASPKLFLACAAGQHFKSALLEIWRSGNDLEPFETWRLGDVVVTAFHTASEGERPLDQITLGFAQIEIDYRPTKADGSVDVSVKAGWDRKKNKAI